MLKHRLIFGTLMVIALTALLWLDNYVTAVPVNILPGAAVLPPGIIMLAVVLLLVVLSSRELATMGKAKQIPCDAKLLGIAGVVFCIAAYLTPLLPAQTAAPIFATIFALTMLAAMFRHNWARKSTDQGLVTIGFAMLALVYLGVFASFYIGIRHHYSAWVIAAVIMIIKCCDIGAYFTGRAVGKHKLIPWLSPGKTIEGLVGGMIFSALIAVLFALASNHYNASGYWVLNSGEPTFVTKPFPLIWTAVCGAVFGGVGQLGDLTESLFKRDAGVKDSGNSIPGFGGVLDIVDSPLGVAPLAYWALQLHYVA